MTDELDVMRKAVMQYDKAIRLKNINQELYDHLVGSIVWLLKYSAKYNITIPKKEELYRMVKRAQFLIDEMDIALSSTPPTEDQQRNKTTDDSTEPRFVIVTHFL
jgi:hypothetical protein